MAVIMQLKPGSHSQVLCGHLCCVLHCSLKYSFPGKEGCCGNLMRGVWHLKNQEKKSPLVSVSSRYLL